MKTIKLAPSDFAFLYEDCKKCFYNKISENIKIPSTPFPVIFEKLATVMSADCQGVWLNEKDPNLPDGKIIQSGVWVKSKFVEYPELDYEHFISGKVQHLLEMRDGSHCVVAFKTSETPKFDKLYMRQLHAYAYALANPMHKGYAPLNISSIGLIIFDPTVSFTINGDQTADIFGKLEYKPFPYMPEKFEEFMRKFAEILSAKEAPEGNPECPYCQRDEIMISRWVQKIYGSGESHQNKDLVVSVEEDDQ